jgi:hypothetical protein
LYAAGYRDPDDKRKKLTWEKFAKNTYAESLVESAYWSSFTRGNVIKSSKSETTAIQFQDLVKRIYKAKLAREMAQVVLHQNASTWLLSTVNVSNEMCGIYETSYSKVLALRIPTEDVKQYIRKLDIGNNSLFTPTLFLLLEIVLKLISIMCQDVRRSISHISNNSSLYLSILVFVLMTSV